MINNNKNNNNSFTKEGRQSCSFDFFQFLSDRLDEALKGCMNNSIVITVLNIFDHDTRTLRRKTPTDVLYLPLKPRLQSSFDSYSDRDVPEGSSNIAIVNSHQKYTFAPRAAIRTQASTSLYIDRFQRDNLRSKERGMADKRAEISR